MEMNSMYTKVILTIIAIALIIIAGIQGYNLVSSLGSNDSTSIGEKTVNETTEANPVAQNQNGKQKGKTVNDYKELIGLTVSVAEKTLASENMSLTVVSDGPERHDYTNDFKKGSIAATDYIISEVVHIDNENNNCLVFVKSNVQVMMEKEEEDFKKDQLNQVLDLKAAWEAFNQYANAGDMGVSVELYKFRSGPVEVDPNYKEEVGEDNTWILQCSAVVDGVEGRSAWAQIGGTTEHPYVIQCGAG